MGLGSALFFMESGIRVTPKIGSGINILGKTMGSVVKKYMP